jgi:hypothetical protein
MLLAFQAVLAPKIGQNRVLTYLGAILLVEWLGFVAIWAYFGYVRGYWGQFPSSPWQIVSAVLGAVGILWGYLSRRIAVR